MIRLISMVIAATGIDCFAEKSSAQKAEPTRTIAMASTCDTLKKVGFDVELGKPGNLESIMTNPDRRSDGFYIEGKITSLGRYIVGACSFVRIQFASPEDARINYRPIPGNMITLTFLPTQNMHDGLRLGDSVFINKNGADSIWIEQVKK